MVLKKVMYCKSKIKDQKITLRILFLSNGKLAGGNHFADFMKLTMVLPCMLILKIQTVLF